MMYAELMGNHKKQGIKSLCDNKIAYVEFGTGSKGDKSVAHTTKKQWTYYSGGQFFTTSGHAPQPFLVPALKNNSAEIKRIIRQAVMR